jgi:hypothetical protein
MDHMLSRIWDDLGSRLTGPLSFRLILQPAMALFFGIRDGMRDARAGRSPYSWALVSDPVRGPELREAWRAVGRVFLLAVAMDAIYQYLVLRWFYPGEALSSPSSLPWSPTC